MDQSNISHVVYPVLILPKHSTKLESICEVSDNVFIKLRITSPDTDGNEMCIYSGFCNVKLIDGCNGNFHLIELSMENGTLSVVDNKSQGENVSQIDNQSQVWIDPVRSPYVYNSYDENGTQELILPQTPYGQITVEQHNTYITQNVYNYSNTTYTSNQEDFEQKRCRKTVVAEESPQHAADMNNYISFYEVDEFECGVFLSQLPEEIMNEKEIKDREEKRYIGLDSEDGALKQLMSPDIQSVSKQRKTILFLGHDSHYGQTIQKIAVNDPSLICAGSEDVDYEVEICDTVSEKADHKKFQCDKCKQIFDQISAFKNHMVGIHKTHRTTSTPKLDLSKSDDVRYMCTDCGKTLKNQKRFEIHCMGHGDPDLECNKCHKVFASKFTLRTHRKIHNRKYPCEYCSKTYSDSEAMREHVAKAHSIFLCDNCPFGTEDYSSLELHIQDIHSTQTDENDYFADIVGEADIITISPGGHELKDTEDFAIDKESEIQEADSIIAKVINNEVFHLPSKKAKRRRRYKKTCDVCFKVFERVGDLKRHLIEHVIRSTLAKTPVSRSGTLNIQCEICRVESFSQIDRYKAHLREHAKLTLYKCTFCDKSFSDSSNFSKHKKIHGSGYFQCDICQRKFNSKKMITQHMEYHTKNKPVHCLYCDKVFHFDSMLKKHMRSAHVKESMNKFRCRFCYNYFKSLKDKWDHEWMVHNVRKMIVDCLVCGSKFRKYSELKRHCNEIHEMEIPPAKKLLRKKKLK